MICSCCPKRRRAFPNYAAFHKALLLRAPSGVGSASLRRGTGDLKYRRLGLLLSDNQDTHMKHPAGNNPGREDESRSYELELEELRAIMASKDERIASLEASEARYRQAVETSPNAILTVDRQEKILAWNESCVRVSGRSIAVGQDLSSLIVSTVGAGHLSEIVSGVFSGQSYSHLTLAYITPDESKIKLMSRAYPVLNQEGAVVECVLANTELLFADLKRESRRESSTDPEREVVERTLELVSANVALKREMAIRKRFEDKLRESEERYRSLVQNSSTGIYIFQDGKFVFANDRIEEITGYQIQEIVGKNYRDFVHPDYIHLISAIPDAEEFEFCEPHRYEFCGIHKNGKSLWVEVFFGFVRYLGRPAVMGEVLDITARKKAEHALQESEERYRAIFENAEDIIFIKDKESKYVNVNPAMEAFLDLPAAKIIGKTDTSVFDAQEGVHTRSMDELVLKGQTVVEEQTKLVGDTVTTFHVIKAPLRSVSNEIAGILGIARDVSDRKKVEEALRDKERMLQTTLTASPVAISYVENAKLKWSNQAMAEMFGYGEEDEYLGTKARDFYASEDEYHRVRRIFVQAISKGEPVETEAKFKRQDGSIFHGQLKITALDHSNVKKGTISSIADISDRKKAEEALRKSRSRYRALFEQWQRIAELYRTLLDASPDPVVVYDIEGLPTYLNSAFSQVFGWSFEEVQGKRIDFVPEDNWPETRQMIDKIIKGQNFSNVETRRRTKEGKVIDVSISGASYYDEHGKVAGSVIQLRDITEYKLMEEQLRQAAKMEAIGKLAGGVAHDFNNLLTAMMGYSQILMRQLPEGGRHQDTLARIIRAAERAAEVTRQLLAFGRKQLLEMKTLDLNTLILDLEPMLQGLIGEHILLSIKLDADLGYIRADPGQIEQIILNLVVNARDAMPAQGALTIETANVNLDEDSLHTRDDVSGGPHVVLEVRDTGLGMSPETLSKIFDPFFTTKEKGVGTGLGLSTVYGIVKQHRGRILVDSELGAGTTFRVFIPKVTDTAAQVDQPQNIAAHPRGSETVLVVEDEAIVRDLACEMLRMLGYNTLMAGDPQEALELCHRHGGAIDLVLTDVVLPKMDGKTLFNEISSFMPNAKVIFMSGYTDNAIGRHGVLEHGVQFLPKPFSVDLLASKIREVLD